MLWPPNVILGVRLYTVSVLVRSDCKEFRLLFGPNPDRTIHANTVNMALSDADVSKQVGVRGKLV